MAVTGIDPRLDAIALHASDWRDGARLREYFLANTGRQIDKWLHYFEIYDRHFKRFRGRQVNVLEIGVQHGGSLQMWKDYFGPAARIFGVDIDPRCKAFEDGQVAIFTGDQADRGFLEALRGALPRVDVLIDDGGHTMAQQIATFDVLFDHVADEGVYLCEDLHTSYWPPFGGGYRQDTSFIEFSKRLIDQLNAWHSCQPDELQPDGFTWTAHSMHYYDSVLVIEKRRMRPPGSLRTGTPSF